MCLNKHRQITEILLFIILISCAWCHRCSRKPDGYGAYKTPADGRFHLKISSGTAKYNPGETYMISLEGIDIGPKQNPPLRYKFVGFMIAVERKSNESATLIVEDFSSGEHGIFTINPENIQAKLICGNLVTHATTMPKNEIQVAWTAPQRNSGCVVFRATVIEQRDVWYMDDGPLSKEFCEDDSILEDLPMIHNKMCCACSEAKYELTFEGLWTRNTHPKDFPTNNWLTRFSDIIGATHSTEYWFWKYGEIASEGLRQVAEHGATRTLESELKNNSEHIRTIIKARGLAYPNVTGKTFAVFRVDPVHHLVSFVSMLDPSPDWFVGISGLELCQQNCTWADYKIVELYPWDAGTDSGPTYISADQPTNPRDLIRRIKTDYPNDPRSPFFDQSEAKMKPLAKLTMLRQRLYEKSCPTNSDSKPCLTTQWSSWTECNPKCGRGFRYKNREFLNRTLATKSGCKDKLYIREPCENFCKENDEASNNQNNDPNCALTEYGAWSECSAKCGEGEQFKTRQYVLPRAKKKCEGGTNYPLLKLRRTCNNGPCVGEIDKTESEGQPSLTEHQCKEYHWKNYDGCSKPCGGGIFVEYNVPVNNLICGNVPIDNRTTSCNEEECHTPEFCQEPPNTGSCNKLELANKWFYHFKEKCCKLFTYTCGNEKATDINRFDSRYQCMKICSGITDSSYYSCNRIVNA